MRMDEEQFIKWMKKFHKTDVTLNEGIDIKGYNVQIMVACGQLKELFTKLAAELERDGFNEFATQFTQLKDSVWNDLQGKIADIMSPAIKAVDAKQGTEQEATPALPNNDLNSNPGGDTNNG